jgi:hypothetical protein
MSLSLSLVQHDDYYVRHHDHHAHVIYTGDRHHKRSEIIEEKREPHHEVYIDDGVSPAAPESSM